MRRIQIFDTTLRDGEQSPGVHLNLDEKVRIAKQLEKLGVDRIEAGFPIASPGEVKNVQAISKEVRQTSVCGLARAHQKDIDACREALKDAADPAIHVFLATSPIHRKHKLNMSKDEVIETAVRAVRYASKYFSEIEFSLEDASRTEPEFMYRVIDEAIRAGAKVINLPDTVGFASPENFGAMFTNVRENVSASDKVMLSTHCHNDLGMATANALAAIKGGADQVEGTINGIGERAGNTALEEVVLALETRPEVYEATTGIVLSEIYETSQLVHELTGMIVQPNKAIVGEHAFRHESGIHQDGMLKESSTYEIIKPETIGATASTLVLGKHSGRHALGQKLNQLGYDLTREELATAFERFKQIIDEKQHITDDELHELANENFEKSHSYYTLKSANINYEADDVRLDIELMNEEKGRQKINSVGTDVIDALTSGIQSLDRKDFSVKDYFIRTRRNGECLENEATVQLEKDGDVLTGRAVNSDFFKASTVAFLNAYNQLFTENTKGDSTFTYMN